MVEEESTMDYSRLDPVRRRVTPQQLDLVEYIAKSLVEKFPDVSPVRILTLAVE